MWESHPYLSNPKAFDIFSVVKLSLLAAMVSFLGALKRNAKKRKQILGCHLGTWLLKQFLSDKVALPIWGTEHLLSFCEPAILVVVAGRECHGLSSINILVSVSNGLP